MDKQKDLVVFDNEFYKAKEDLKEYGSELSNLISRYTTSVDAIMVMAIKDQLITRALRNLVEQIKPFRKAILEVTQEIGDNSSIFVQKIDEADRFLY